MISKIYKAIKDKKNIVLRGPRGCGKATIIAGVLFRVPKKEVCWHDDPGFRHPVDIVVWDVRSPEGWEHLPNTRGAKFLMETADDYEIPEHIQNDPEWVVLNMTHNTDLKKSLTVPLFASRDTVPEAYEYAIAILKGAGADELSILAALHVLMNSIAEKINA